jgi:hypothetical protein
MNWASAVQATTATRMPTPPSRPSSASDCTGLSAVFQSTRRRRSGGSDSGRTNQP